jgi:hypothetical protein
VRSRCNGAAPVVLGRGRGADWIPMIEGEAVAVVLMLRRHQQQKHRRRWKQKTVDRLND